LNGTGEEEKRKEKRMRKEEEGKKKPRIGVTKAALRSAPLPAKLRMKKKEGGKEGKTSKKKRKRG